MVKIQGHRGFPDLYPENTMISFIKTMEAGADAAEMDVRVTADGEYIILHDETLDRTTDGTGNAKFVNYNGYIDTLDAGAWFGSEFVGTKVPRLEDVLSYFKGKDFKLVLQLYFTGVSRIQNIRDVLDKVVAHGMINKVYIFANPEDINEVKSYNSSFFTMNSGMATISTFQDILDNAVTYGHNAVSITNNASDTDLATMISVIKSAGKEVHISYLTTNYDSRIQRYIDARADYVLGNNPLAMQQYADSVLRPGKKMGGKLFRSNAYINKEGKRFVADLYERKDFGFLKLDTYNLLYGSTGVEKMNIIAVGDSNTFGLYLPTADNYPSQMNVLLGDAGEVMNKGVSSDRVANVVARLDDIKAKKVEGMRNIITLQIGTNDSTDNRGASVIYNDINSLLIEPLQAHGFEVWSITVPPRGDSVTVNERVKSLNTLLRGNTLPDNIIDLYPHLVDENDIFDPAMFVSDQKHLSKLACTILANLILDDLNI